MKKYAYIIILIVLLILLPFFLKNNSAEAEPEIPPFDSFDAYVQQLMDDWQVPGLAVSVVYEGQVAFAKGYGVRAAGTKDPVNKDTIFPISSLTKSFTAAALAILASEGKIQWDDHVSKYLPNFSLSDACASTEANLSDLLCHRTGIPYQKSNLLWFVFDEDKQELLKNIQFVPLEYEFRTHFTFNDITYVALGEVIPAITGNSWSDFVTNRLLKPLNMNATSTGLGSTTNSNLVKGHELKNNGKPAFFGGTLNPVDLKNRDSVAAAIGLNSSVSDMAKWLQFNISKGQFNNQVLINSSLYDALVTSQQLFSADGYFYPPTAHEMQQVYFPNSHAITYGFGWMRYDYRGYLVVGHPGNIEGTNSLMAIVPDLGLGISILVNVSPTPAHFFLLHRIIDAYAELPPNDFEQSSRKALVQIQTVWQRAEDEFNQLPASPLPPSLAPGAYAGQYTNLAFGTFNIVVANGIMQFDREGKSMGELKHWNGDTFLYVPNEQTHLSKALIEFSLDIAKSIQGFQYEGLGYFERQP